MWLFHVGNVVQNRRSTLSLVWHKYFYAKEENEDLLLQACIVIRTSSTKISSRHLADYVNKLHQKACCTITFPNSTKSLFLKLPTVVTCTYFSFFRFTCAPDSFTHTNVIAATLSSYLSLLDESCIKKLSACIKSDCSHWLTKLFG